MVFIHLNWSKPGPCLPPSLAFLHFLNYGCDPYLSYFQNKQSIAGKDETKSTLVNKKSIFNVLSYILSGWMQLKRSLKSLKNKLTKKGEKMKWQWECLVKIQIPKIQAWFSCLAFGDHKIIPQNFCRVNIFTFPQQEHCFSRLKGNSQYEEYKELYDSKSEQSAVWLWHHLRDARRLVRRWNLPAGFLKSTISWLFDARGEWEIAQNTTLPGIAVSMKLPQRRSTKITQPHHAVPSTQRRS